MPGFLLFRVCAGARRIITIQFARSDWFLSCKSKAEV